MCVSVLIKIFEHRLVFFLAMKGGNKERLNVLISRLIATHVVPTLMYVVQYLLCISSVGCERCWSSLTNSIAIGSSISLGWRLW